MEISRGEWAVLGFTIAYMAGFTLFFLAGGDGEFLWYAATMALLVGLVAWLARQAEVPVALLWALTGWGFAHMAGGGVPVGDTVLYGVQLLPLVGEGELRLLKYDQVVHFYGFGTTAWLLWHLMGHYHPGMRGSWALLIYPALGAMGLGAANEMVEFAAVLIFPQTGVGGYYNTALDLVFNAAGAVSAMAVVARVAR
ncbi:MAG TPA: DUF2238 domain-containing protein [Thermohalobaculum sp.]|nr:DUF2238 domain-containing protein [Thermohalobaculum sp.]